MKLGIDSKQVKNIRWRNGLDTDQQEWSPKQQWLLIAMLMVALSV
ncbi:hypothetical protein SPSIL_014810 [Sporomusa silvacetica DSM 10669]|uniref:Uncharacterized protein n=1 Tax=Sporomusa silvacetica DSM 10669 TaxID=1123289 RepID=A0ABZ3II82_9FIRM|nr:hypothetical protein SPSIL_09540 [Sporomusa silvacetica DSM 10669]